MDNKDHDIKVLPKNLYALYDIKSGSYSDPMALRTDGEAIRICQDSVNDPQQKSFLSKFPDDYRLDIIGTFDIITGKVRGLENPVPIINLSQLVKK